MPPIRLGIIGCGIAARELHWPALQQLKRDFEIVMVCNHTEDKAATFAEMVGDVPYTLDYSEMLTDETVEAVVIVVPIHLNHRICRDAILAGKHILLEKPLAANEIDARELVKLAGRYEKVVAVGENIRYRPTIFRAKSLLETGAIGQPYAVRWNFYHYVDKENKFAQTAWRIQHQYDGGFITDAGIHNIATIRMLFGDIASGQGRGMSVNSSIGEMDTLSFQFSTQSGIIGELFIGFSIHGYNENTLLVFGTEGSLRIQGNQVEVYSKDGSSKVEDITDDGGYTDQYRDFCTAIRTGRPVRSSFKQAYTDLTTILGAVHSAQTGQPFIAVH